LIDDVLSSWSCVAASTIVDLHVSCEVFTGLLHRTTPSERQLARLQDAVLMYVEHLDSETGDLLVKFHCQSPYHAQALVGLLDVRVIDFPRQLTPDIHNVKSILNINIPSTSFLCFVSINSRSIVIKIFQVCYTNAILIYISGAIV